MRTAAIQEFARQSQRSRVAGEHFDGPKGKPMRGLARALASLESQGAGKENFGTAFLIESFFFRGGTT